MPCSKPRSSWRATALGQGDGLGLVVFADQVDAYLHPRRERAQLKAVIENLYAKQPRLVEPNYELALTLAAKRNVRRTLFILLTDVTVIEAARRMLLYLRILTPRHLAAGRDHRRRDARAK